MALLQKLKDKRLLILDLGVLITILVIVWGLLSLPAVFYYINQGKSGGSANQTNSPTNSSVTTDRCIDPISYSGTVCRSQLLAAGGCNPGNGGGTTNPLVIKDATQEATMLTNLLSSANPACAAAALPFLCLFTFVGVCDEVGNLYRPTSAECTSISTGVCLQDFELARRFGFQLPDCSSLPDRRPERTCNDSGSGMELETSPVTSLQSSMTPPLACYLTCRENFFCDKTTATCVPRCPNWNLFTPAGTLALDIMVGLSAALGGVAGVAVIITSLIRWKQVYVFPSVLVIYEVIGILVLISCHLITFMDRATLYCTSPNLSKSITTATSFCILTGVVTSYVPLQVNFFWSVHMVVLLWTILYPLKANTKETKRRFRILHIVVVIVGLIGPTAPVIATIVDSFISSSSITALGRLGYGLGSFPPILCVGLNPVIVFHFAILPIVILLIIGISSLVIMIWTIHRKYGIMTSIKSNSPSFSLSTAEKKLLIVFCYYILTQVVVLVYFSRTQQVGPKLGRRIVSYFSCEQSGYDPSKPCSRSSFETLINPALATLAFTLALLLPVISFVFVVDCGMLKKKISDVKTHFQSLSNGLESTSGKEQTKEKP